MAEKSNPPCDLCGLDVESEDFVIRTREKTLKFCCEGCVGIFRMLNDPEEIDENIDQAAE